MQKTLFGALALFCIAFAANAFAQDATDATAQRVYIIDCGHIVFKDMAIFSDTGEYDRQTRELSDMCVLVKHPKGTLLWDTGLPANDRDHEMHNGITHYVTKTLQEQLAAIGVKPENVDYVTISHAHFDHAGNLNDFTHSTWLMQANELAYVQHTPTPFGVNPDNFSGTKTAKVKIIDGDYDVFGDGSVRFFRAPGHTPGHQVMLVKLKSGNLLFSGDLYHQRESYQKGIVPAFNNSRADTMASSDRIHRLLTTYNAKLIIQHDKGDFDALPAFPAYIE